MREGMSSSAKATLLPSGELEGVALAPGSAQDDALAHAFSAVRAVSARENDVEQVTRWPLRTSPRGRPDARRAGAPAHRPGALAETASGVVLYRARETWRGMHRYYRRMRREPERLDLRVPETAPAHRARGRRNADLLAETKAW